MLVSIVLIILLSFWHGVSSRLDPGFRKKNDYLVAIVCACVYVLFLIIFVIAAIIGVSTKYLFMCLRIYKFTKVDDNNQFSRLRCLLCLYVLFFFYFFHF